MARRYDDDPDLVRAAQAGDEAAFTTLFQRWFDPCNDVARRIVRDPEIAAEVAQDTFLVAWRQLGELRDPSAFGGWVLRTSRNKALNRLERERRSVAVDQDEDPALAGLSSEDDVDRDLAVADQHDLVWAAAAALGERDASVLDLHLRHGLDAKEIGLALDVTTNNAHQLLFRMKGRLAGAIRAWVVFRGGRPSCPDLRGALAAAGHPTFSASTVKLVERHVGECDECGRRQAAILAPEAMFAAVPLLPVAAVLRDRVAAGLRAEGVPLGPEAGLPAEASDGGADGAVAVDAPSAAPDPSEAVEAPDGLEEARSGPRRALVATAVVLVLAVLALLALGGWAVARSGEDTGQVALVDGGSATTSDTAPRSGTSAPATDPAVSVVPDSTTSSDPSPTTTEDATTTTGVAEEPAPPAPPPPPAAAPRVIEFTVGQPPAPGADGTPCPPGQWRFSLSWRTADSTGVTLSTNSGPWTATGGPVGATQGCALTPSAAWVLTVVGEGGTTTATG
jgi:RNA polymerase sigma factor (sigma-70 family)